MSEERERKWRVVREIRRGRMTLSQCERTDARGVVQRLWAVGRDDGRGASGKLVTMAAGDLRDFVQVARDLVRALRSERERSSPREASRAREAEPKRAPERKRGPDGAKLWHAVVRVVEVAGGGVAKAEVVKSFDDYMAAKTFRDKNPGRCLHNEPFFGERPADGAKLDLRYGPGERWDVNREVGQHLHKRGRGEAYCWGVWYDKGSQPRVGQQVYFTVGIDARGLLEDRKVTPLRPEKLGQPDERLFVVFKKSLTVPGLAEVVAVEAVKRNAMAKVEEFDLERQARRNASAVAMDPQQWRQQSFGRQMRRELGL